MAETQRTPAAALSEVHPHPAAQAWRASGGALAVERVESLRQGRHCRVDRLVIVDIGPEISEAGMLRVGTLMARSPELFTSLEHALSFHRVTNPLYTEAMLRHRVEHGTRAVEGGLTWKYDRGLRDAVRAGTWRDPIDLWPLWRGIACPILLVRGADSDVLSPEIAKRMLEENSNTRYAEVAGAGHTVPGDQPAAFRTLLTDFLSA